MGHFIALLRDQSGATAAEYAMILAIVGGGLAIAAVFLGTTMSNSINNSANCMEDAGSVAC